jgi:WD domain, G-beta repeat
VTDAYSEWLDIPANLRPPTYYQLLGIAPSELDAKAIAAAADRRLELLRAHEAGPRADECRRIAREVVQARDTLTDPVSRLRYDTMTPDAADPWWKPEGESGRATEPQPVEGWWQGESPDVEPPPSATPKAVEAPSGPGPKEVPSPSPVAAKSDDWWKGSAADAVQVEPAPVPPPVSRPAPPIPAVAPAPPPVRTESVQPSGALIREQSLAYTSPGSGRSPAMWVILGVVVLGLGAVGVIYATRPAGGDRTDDKQVAEHKDKGEPAPPVVPLVKNGPDTLPKPPTKDPENHLPPPIKTPPTPPKKPPEPPTASEDVVEPVTFRGHKGGVLGLAVSRNGKSIVSISDDQNALHYSPAERGKHSQLHHLASPGIGIVLCNDDRDAAFCDGGEAVFFSLADRKPRARFENPRGGLRSIAAAPDGAFVLAGTTDGAVRWWNTKSKTLEQSLDVDAKATVGALAITADGRRLAMGLSDGRVAVWDLKQRRETKRWKAHAGAVTAVACSADGQRIISTGEDGIANVWQPGGKLIQKLAGHDGPVTCAAWCSDGRSVVTAGIDRTVRRWAEDAGWKTDWNNTVADKVFSLAIDARDRFVVVGESDGAVQLIPLPRPSDAAGG